MVAEAKMHRHLKPVSNDLGFVETSSVFKIEVVVGGGIVVEVIADQKHLFDGRLERIDKIPCRDEPRSSYQNALVVLHSVLAAFDVEVVDDVRVGDKSEVELIR